MPTAICPSCQATHHWRNQRGVRLADMRCHCGSALRAARWTPNGYEARQGRRETGYKMDRCAVCQRRRRILYALSRPARFRQYLQGVGVEFPAGTKVCGIHYEVDAEGFAINASQTPHTFAYLCAKEIGHPTGSVR